MSRISTGTGDDGTTGLADGSRVQKTHPRVEAYGAVDEANDALGLAAAFTEDPAVRARLARLQHDLFTLGADLATPRSEKTAAWALRITEEHVRYVEGETDALETALPPLRHFILPGGAKSAAFLQLARSMVRRAERQALRFREAGGEVNPLAVIYLNRLSDLLFLMARAENQAQGIAEPQWLGRDGKR
ncbi:MAG TPA: cob(I)yrinic acid a,c-diamide adenosyltransferase [Candidatus Thermoplasmatota archaeon]|nr:cob(I)yrinic acid a,c-diamide adenosyltransferase [Candidatus Thermoplasmatota archaeon]